MKYFTILTVAALFVSTAAYSQDLEPEDLVIDGIECTGNALTDCEIIKREIYLNVGDKVNEEEIENSTIRLQLLNLFKVVNVSLKKGNDRGHVVLNVDVVEDSPLFSETSIFHSNPSNYLGLAVKLGHRNLFGTGKILQGTFSPPGLTKYEEKTYSGNLEYIDPHLFGHKKYFLSAKFANSFTDDVNTSYDLLLRTTEFTSFTFNLGRRIFDFSHIGIGTTKSYWTWLYRNSLNESLRKIKSEGTEYTLNYGWNTEDDSYFPTDGSKFDLTYYWPEIGNSVSASAEFKQNFSLNGKNVVALHLKDSFFPDLGNYHSADLGVEWAYQLRRGRAGSAVTDARFFVKPSVRYYTDSGFVGSAIDAGLSIDTESFGILKFTTFYWGL